jgi:membrane protease YdiL (CAAX protease family)
MKQFSLSTSGKIYFGLIIILVILRLILYILPTKYVLANQESMLSWLSILLIVLLGVIGIVLAPKSGFAEMWSGEAENRRRLIVPGIIGLGFGVLAIVLDVMQPLGSEIHIKFPSSLIVYPIGGILEEIIFRLFLTTFLVWLGSTVILRGRGQKKIFWIVAVAVGLLYAILQIGAYITITEEITLAIGVRYLVQIGVYFVVAAYLYRRYGFLGVVTMRMVDYLIWHIIWGALI